MHIFAVFDSTRRILLKAHEFMAQFSTVTTSEKLPAMKSWELPQPSSVPRARPHLKPDGSGTHCVADSILIVLSTLGSCLPDIAVSISPHWLTVYIKLGANPFCGNSFLFHQGCLFPSWLLKSISGDSRTKLGRNPNFPCDTL